MKTQDHSIEASQKAHYSPPWADMSIIGVAGSSGSGKTSLAIEIVRSLALPWVIILSMVRRSVRTIHAAKADLVVGFFLQIVNPGAECARACQ